MSDRVTTDLADGVRVFQSPMWQTNTLRVRVENSTLLVDPAFYPDELVALREETVRDGDGALHLLVTHADFDHTCGIGYFPHAEVIAGRATAERIASGEAAAALEDQGPEYGAAWPTQLRTDTVVPAGTAFTAGPFRVATVDAPGHGPDGLAYVLADHGILVPGDYLSAITYPFVTHSLAETRATVSRLLAALDEHPVRWVVPGHGPVLSADDARRVGAADLEYVDRLAAAADAAHDEALAPAHALLEVFAVEPPRANTDDFEVYGIRSANAARALAERAA